METEDGRSEPSPSSLSTLNTNTCPSVKDEGSGDVYLPQESPVADQDGSAGRQGGAWACVGGPDGLRAVTATPGCATLWCVNKGGVGTRGETRKRTGSKCSRTTEKNDSAAVEFQQKAAWHSPWRGRPQQTIHLATAYARRRHTSGCRLQPHTGV